MNFRTILNIPKEKNTIDYNSNIVLFGSCFTENMEKHLNYFKFENICNSHGILFNPKSIEKAISDCVLNKEYDQHDLNYFDDIWLSFNHHSKFSSVYLSKILEQINQNIKNTHIALSNSSHVLITLGTSWVYRYQKTETLVANCHKIPQSHFNKEILSTDENIKILKQIISLIEQINTKTTIIFTVSPVRHLKDGFIENTQSKARLHTAIHQVIDNDKSFYFPSYEIMMDDLRDYRFYKNDLLHPNETAMEYIWNIFKQTWIDENSYNLMKEVDGIQKSLQHKPFKVDSKKHQVFLKKLDKKIEILTKKIPQITFNKDYTQFGGNFGLTKKE
jgi:lysophospholipase L1-like esterase